MSAMLLLRHDGCGIDRQVNTHTRTRANAHSIHENQWTTSDRLRLGLRDHLNLYVNNFNKKCFLARGRHKIFWPYLTLLLIHSNCAWAWREKERGTGTDRDRQRRRKRERKRARERRIQIFKFAHVKPMSRFDSVPSLLGFRHQRKAKVVVWQAWGTFLLREAAE